MFKRIAKLLGLKPKTIATTAAGKKRLADKLESLLETTADAVVGVASNGHIALVNPQTENLFGYLRDEVLGKPVEFLLPEIFQPGILVSSVIRDIAQRKQVQMRLSDAEHNWIKAHSVLGPAWQSRSKAKLVEDQYRAGLHRTFDVAKLVCPARLPHAFRRRVV